MAGNKQIPFPSSKVRWKDFKRVFTLNIGTILFGCLFIYMLFSIILYFTSVSDHNMIRNIHILPDITALPDPGAGLYMGKIPDFCSFSDRHIFINICAFMHKVIIHPSFLRSLHIPIRQFQNCQHPNRRIRICHGFLAGFDTPAKMLQAVI